MIRDAQIGFQSVNGKFANEWDSLLNFVENGKIFLIQRREETVLLDYGAEETTLYLDTLGSVTVIDSLFSSIPNFKASNLTGILFNKGPASFTGTRVAASVTQAIGYSFNIPVIGISSLALMAFKFYKNNNITNIGCVKKAYGEKLYIGHYDIDLHKYEPQDKIKLCTINEIKLHKNYRYVSDDWSNISIDSF